MVNSRILFDLAEPARTKLSALLSAWAAAGLDVIVTSTYRDIESQNALYAQGRTAPGNIVTNAKGGQSFHNYRCAMDVVPIINGKADWTGTDATWQKMGEIAASLGVEWAGHWTKFKEYCHFQYTAGLTLADFQAGKTMPNG